MAAEEFLIWQNAMGAYLRAARLEAGLSMREVETDSGVARSEIHRLETGCQDFRLISFLKLCAALGIPPASILDQSISCNPAFYADRVEREALFKTELTSRKIDPKSSRAGALSMAIGSLAAAAAHLLRSSSPTVIAGLARYPNTRMQASFVLFSKKIAFEIEPLERLGFIKALRTSPIQELKRNHLWNEDYLKSIPEGASLFLFYPDRVPR